MFAPSLLSTLLLALAVAATPIAPVITVRNGPVSLPISRRLNEEGARNLYQNDLKHTNALVKRGSSQANANVSGPVSTPAEGRPIWYLASVGVGTPPTQCEC